MTGNAHASLAQRHDRRSQQHLGGSRSDLHDDADGRDGEVRERHVQHHERGGARRVRGEPDGAIHAEQHDMTDGDGLDALAELQLHEYGQWPDLQFYRCADRECEGCAGRRPTPQQRGFLTTTTNSSKRARVREVLAYSAQNASLPMTTLAMAEERVVAGTLPTDRRFQGEVTVGSIGLIDFGARLMSPVIGRWLSPDTVVPRAGNPQAFNRYSFVLRCARVFVFSPSCHL